MASSYPWIVDYLAYSINNYGKVHEEHFVIAKDTIKTIMFDVFGTVFDWHKSITHGCSVFADKNNLTFNFSAFANNWRKGFRELQAQVANGQREYLSMDSIHLEVLDHLLLDLNIKSIPDKEKTELNQTWHRLDTWEDVKQGLYDLKEDHVITTLSNGNYAILLDLSKYAGLPWDCILSTELFGTYKPDPRVYLGAMNLVESKPEETLMVAAHAYDLDAAKSTGMKTCYVHRPNEFGNGKGENSGDTARFDLTVASFVEIRDSINQQ